MVGRCAYHFVGGGELTALSEVGDSVECSERYIAGIKCLCARLLNSRFWCEDLTGWWCLPDCLGKVLIGINVAASESLVSDKMHDLDPEQ